MKLSICMMVKNEEVNLERCLNSFKHMMDLVESELIIVDTGSTDQTAKIAAQYTNKVFFHEWNNNFSEMRNKSITYATGEWLLIIDADEELVSYNHILSFLTDKQNVKYSGAALYLRNLKNSYSNEYSTELITPRIFKNGIGFKYDGVVHNSPIIKGEILLLEDIINHYGYINDDKELMNKKFNRTRDLLVKELEKDPQNIYYLYQLSTSYAMHGDNAEAYYTSKRTFDLIKISKELSNKSLFAISAYAKDALNYDKYEESLESSKYGLEIESEFLDLYYFAATSLVKLGRIDEAVNFYLGYLDNHENFHNSKMKYDTSIQHYTLHHKEEVITNLSVCFMQIGQLNQAYEYSKIIIDAKDRTSPYYLVALKVYVRCLFDDSNYDELDNILNLEVDFTNEIIKIIEKNIRLKNDVDKKNAYKNLSRNKSSFGKLNEFRYLENEFIWTPENANIIDSLIRQGNDEAYYYALRCRQDISKVIINLSEAALSDLFIKIDEYHTDFSAVIESYLENLDFVDSYYQVYLEKNLLMFLMVKNINSSKAELYFDRYIKVAIKWVEKKYNESYLELNIMNNLQSSEEQFCFCIKKIVDSYDKTYLELAFQIFPDYRNVLIRWLDMNFNNENKSEKNNIVKNSELDNLLEQLKSNIILLRDNGNIEDALILIDEYLRIDPNNIEMVQMKSALMLFD